MSGGRLLIVLLVCPLTGLAAAAVAQTRPVQPPASAAALADGWAALAKGDVAAAGRIANQAMGESPRSAAAVALAVEVDATRAGAAAALATYERWLAGRKVDDAYVLRRVALAYLHEASRDRRQPAVRMEALNALGAEGDAAADADLRTAATTGGFMETRLLASRGDTRAVQTLIAQLRSPGGNKLSIINALVESKSPLAVPPLLELLSDMRPEHRAAAADALGRLDARDTISTIKPLLQDPNFPVRLSAASALYRLDDYSGVNLLEQLLTSEHSAVRMSAAEAMSVRPGGSWLAVVRELTNDPDETVALSAARLVAPYDPELAATVLDRLRQSGNLAVREEAGRIYADRVAGDFASLRRLLHSGDALTVARAARRILELTR